MTIAIAVFCVLCEALFTALEVALGAISRARLRAIVEVEAMASVATEATVNAKAGSHAPALKVPSPQSSAAMRLLQVLEKPDRLTLAFIIVTALTLWTASSLLAWQALSAGWPLWALALVLLLVLFVAEVLPLLAAARNPEVVALRCVGLAEVILKVLSPLIWLLGGVGQGVARLMGASSKATPQVTEGELRAALMEAQVEGVIDNDERTMLEGAMGLGDKNVREVMTPRIDVVGVPSLTPLPAILDLAMHEGHARLPVYESTLDRIIGIVAVKDLIPHLRPQSDHGGASMIAARDVMRPAYFVPEHKRIASALEELRRERTLMAIVVDGNGGTAGLVTLEDLLEEIVGEIEDEYDQEEPSLRVISPEDAASGLRAAIVATGDVSVRDIESFWSTHFQQTLQLLNGQGAHADDSISIAALCMQLFDGVPKAGNRIHAGRIEGRAGNQSTLAAAETDRDATPRENTRDADSETSPAPSREKREANAAAVELEVVAMTGPRIEEVKLHKVL